LKLYRLTARSTLQKTVEKYTLDTTHIIDTYERKRGSNYGMARNDKGKKKLGGKGRKNGGNGAIGAEGRG